MFMPKITFGDGTSKQVSVREAAIVQGLHRQMCSEDELNQAIQAQAVLESKSGGGIRLSAREVSSQVFAQMAGGNPPQHLMV
jgi:hypothetical protein